jgi:hypothetical protein
LGLGDLLKDAGSIAKSAIGGTASGLNSVDKYINPFHVEQGSAKDPSKAGGNSPLGNVLNHQVETASKALNWVYDNGISQPLSTTLMVGELNGGALKSSNWSMAWHAAEHISPAQALFLGSDDNATASTQKAVESPLEYYKPGSAYLPPGFDKLPEAQQQDFLKKAGMPAVGNAYINELRQSSSMYKYATGVGDLALRWWADPTIIAGRTASEIRKASQVVKRPAAGWAAQDYDRIMGSSTMDKAIDFIYTNKDNPQLLNNLQMAKNSALGPRFGAIASTLKSADEVHDFLRVSLGDVSAIESLQGKNALAAARIAQDTSRYSALDAMYTRYANVGNGQMTNLVQQQMKDLTARVNADESLVSRYNQVLGHAGEMDEVNLSRWSFARAQERTDAQAGYRASTARGSTAGALGRRVTVQPTPIFSRGTTAPVDLGFTKTRLYGAGDFFSTPVTMVRSFGNARPNGYMRIDDIDRDSIAELRGQLARIPGIDNQTRLNMLNEYLKTGTEGERLALLKEIGATGAAKVAEKHGLEPEAGLEIYQEHLKRQVGEIDNMKRYSAASKPITTPDGTLAQVKVDEFMTDGGKLVVHPNLVTRLANDHVFQDLDAMDKVLARHSSAISAIRQTKIGNPDWMLDAADYMTHMFKFGTLFRLGYIPRVAGDDLAGQTARLGAASMALRVGWGVRNGATNAALRYTRPLAAARAATAQEGVKYAEEGMAALKAEMDPLRAQIQGRRAATRADLTQAGRRLANAKAKRAAMDPAVTPAAKMSAMDQLIAKHEQAVARATRGMSTAVGAKNIKLQDLEAHHGFLDTYRQLQKKAAAEATAASKAPKVIQGSRPVDLRERARVAKVGPRLGPRQGRPVYAPAAFDGKEGDYFYKATSSDEALGQIFATNKQLVHGHLMRSFDHGGKAITAAEDEAVHATSWAHAINAQLVQDPLAIQAIRGASVEDLTKWLKQTAEGRAYQRRIGLSPSAAAGATGNRIIADPEELANAAWHDVAEYMPTPEIRAKALEPDGVSPAFLKEAMPMAHRPDVHTGQVGGAQSRYKRALDGVVASWFNVAAKMPADRLSRHPLFNQLYEGHMKTLASQLKKQGAYDTTVAGVEQMATTARRLALRDTRKLVFDIAHRSDAAAALRFISPFMAATTESFQRWGRIIADRPQVVGYANNFFNAPIASGNMQDADGNDVSKDGYSYTIDPATGKAVKKLVPKSERFIVARMPKALLNNPVTKYTIGTTFGIEPASGKLKLSQNSMDLVTQGDPWFHPGVGPIVQVPVNMLVKDKPKQAELARQLGVLPFGPVNGGAFGSGPAGEIASFFAPSTVKNFLTAFDTSDDRYQNVKMQIMQRAAYEHSELGKPMPSASKIASMTRDYWLFSAASAFLQPMATQKADKYQFFRDQYNALRRENPMTADDQFIARYGESYFIFAQTQSKNDSGIPSTVKAVELSKKYGDLIAANPELGALVVGPEGNGPFSPEAYSYQLNTPLAPGGSEMQRSKMSATDAMLDNKRRQGWSEYTKAMNGLTATLHNRGLNSFADKGAEDLKATKAAYVQLFGSPTMPNGQANPFYNDSWSKDYNTLDPLKYERLIPGLQAVADSPLAKDPTRSDLRVLQQYLGYRQGVTQMLAARKAAGGSGVITAKANADLLNAWQSGVDSLIESDTNFGDLHSRYLARDLGYDGSTDVAA